MTSSKHTPGPWVIYEKPRQPGQLAPSVAREITGTGGIPVIADLRWNGENEKHGEANARLIAAAPELGEELDNTVAALESCMAHYGPKMPAADQRSREAQIIKARAVLTKATGGQP